MGKIKTDCLEANTVNATSTIHGLQLSVTRDVVAANLKATDKLFLNGTSMPQSLLQHLDALIATKGYDYGRALQKFVEMLCQLKNLDQGIANLKAIAELDASQMNKLLQAAGSGTVVTPGATTSSKPKTTASPTSAGSTPGTTPGSTPGTTVLTPPPTTLKPTRPPHSVPVTTAPQTTPFPTTSPWATQAHTSLPQTSPAQPTTAPAPTSAPRTTLPMTTLPFTTRPVRLPNAVEGPSIEETPAPSAPNKQTPATDLEIIPPVHGGWGGFEAPGIE